MAESVSTVGSGGDHETLAEWQTAEAASDWSTDTPVAEIISDLSGQSAFVMSGWNLGAGAIIRPSLGNEAFMDPAGGFLYSGGVSTLITINEPGVEIRDLRIQNTVGKALVISGTGQSCKIDSNIFINRAGAATVSLNDYDEFTNNILYGAAGYGIYTYNNPSVRIYNNLVDLVSDAGIGIYIGNTATVYCSNNIVMNAAATTYYHTGTAAYSGTNNAVDANCSQSETFITITDAAESDFTDFANNDYTLDTAGVTRFDGEGTNLDSYFTNDALGNTRPSSPDAWTVGPQQIEAAAAFTGTGDGDLTAITASATAGSVVPAFSGVAAGVLQAITAEASDNKLISGTAAGVLQAITASATSRILGVLITSPITNNTGTLQVSESSVVVDVYSLVDGELVEQFTGETTNGSAVCEVSSAAITLGTTYRVVPKLSDGSYGIQEIEAT